MLIPERCEQAVRKITGALRVSEETAYTMLLTIAALMDLRPEDDAVAQMVLTDCGIKE